MDYLTLAAWHESGHAITCHALNCRLHRVHIIRANGSDGFCGHDECDARSWAVIAAAGPIAESFASGQPIDWRGGASDWLKVRDYASAAMPQAAAILRASWKDVAWLANNLVRLRDIDGKEIEDALRSRKGSNRMDKVFNLAAHEAAHALAVLVSAKNASIAKLTLTRHDNGSASSVCNWPDLADPLDEMFALAAGPAMTKRLDPNCSDPWDRRTDDDWPHFQRLAAQYPQHRQRAIDLANRFVETEEDGIRAIADTLLKRGSLSTADVFAAVSNAAA